MQFTDLKKQNRQLTYWNQLELTNQSNETVFQTSSDALFLHHGWKQWRDLVLAPLFHPKPSFPRWFGDIVISLKRSRIVSHAVRHRIRSTSSSGPEKWKKELVI